MPAHTLVNRLRRPGPFLSVALAVLPAVMPWPSSAQDVAGVRSVDSRLFESHDVIEFSIAANFVQLSADRGLDPEYRAALMTLTDDSGASRSIEMEVKTRGRFRLENCLVPPLRINLPKNSLGGTVFEGEDKVKLVGHCRNTDADEQNVLEEYLAYRIYNVLTDHSLRVRLARITYVDARGRNAPVRRYGFLIEERESMALRVEGLMLEMLEVDPALLDGEASARMALFHYMIGNTDWELASFHNVELLQTLDGAYVPVPYDFDFSGLVAAPYAEPDEKLGLSTIQERMYRGFCRPDVNFPSLYEEVIEQRGAIEEIVGGVEGLGESERGEALDYLNGFYEVVASEERSELLIEGVCRAL